MSAPVTTPPPGSAATPDENIARTTHLAAYATGSLGMGVWVTVPGMLLLYFMTNTLGVSPLWAGLALLLPKVLDAIVHPTFGTWSDRMARRDGHRRAMLRWGLLLAIAMAAMFTVPAALTGVPAALWVAGWYIVGNLLFASFQVPYLTTPSDMEVGYHERTRVFMVRMIFLTVGLLAAGVIAPAMVADHARSSYSTMAICLGVVMVISGAVAIRGVRRLTETCGFRTPDADEHRSTWADVKVACRDRDFRYLVLSYLFTGTTTHLVLAAVPFYATHVLGRTGLTAVLMGAFLAPALFASPIWLRVSKRIGKQRGLLTSQVIFIVGTAVLVLGDSLGVAATVAIVALLGISFAGLQLFAFSMVPDAVAAAERHGSSRAGSYTGVWTATEAVGTAIGPYVYSAVLAAGGFAAAVAGQEVAQSDTAVDAVRIGFTVVPAVLMTIAVLFQRLCRLDANAPLAAAADAAPTDAAR